MERYNIMSMPTQIISPDISGYYGDYGGMFIPEILRTTFEKLISSFKEADGLVVGSQIVKTLSNSLKKRQNPVTIINKMVNKLKKEII